MDERGETSGVGIEPMAPLTRLLLAYASPPERRAHQLIWAYDERLAALVRSTTQPMIGQMRIAWWDEVLGDVGQAGVPGRKGAGDPLVDALRSAGIARRPGLSRMLDGWEALLETPLTDDALLLFAKARGGGLFAALADDAGDEDGLIVAGSLWAMWDLAAHLPPGDPAAARAVTLARQWLEPVETMHWQRPHKPLRIATMLARADIARGAVPQPGLTPTRYARLLRVAMLGR